jgi:hypothetical protein
MMNVDLFDKLSVGREHLQPEVLSISDHDLVGTKHAYVVGQAELPSISSRLSPGRHVFAVRGELVNTRVAITVGHEQLASSSMNSDIGRTIEHSTALPFAWLTLGSQCEHNFAIVRSLLDKVAIVIYKIEIVVRVDLDAVRAHKIAMTHPSQEIAIGVEHSNWFRASIEYVNVVLRIDGYRSGVTSKCHAHGQLCPARNWFEFSL